MTQPFGWQSEQLEKYLCQKMTATNQQLKPAFPADSRCILTKKALFEYTDEPAINRKKIEETIGNETHAIAHISPFSGITCDDIG